MHFTFIRHLHGCGQGPFAPSTYVLPLRFWGIGRTDIGRLGALKGSKMQDGASLFSALMKVTIDILDCDEDTALMRVGRRVPQTQNEQHVADMLTSIDAAIEVIDQNDRQLFKDEQKKAVTSSENMSNFLLEFQTRRAEVDGKLPEKRKKVDTSKPHLPKTIVQAEAACVVPPGSHIWLSNASPQWHGHLEPYKRVWAKWEGGEAQEAEAVNSVIRQLWQQYLQSRGRTISDCPFEGVFG